MGNLPAIWPRLLERVVTEGHATLGAEEGRFTLADVARGIHDKLVLRHPHVFAEV